MLIWLKMGVAGFSHLNGEGNPRHEVSTTCVSAWIQGALIDPPAHGGGTDLISS